MKEKIKEALLDLFFPLKCPFCHRLLEEDEKTDGLCSLCRKVLPHTHEEGKQSFDGVEECVSPLWYREEVRESIHNYKFSDRAVYARGYAHLMADCVREYMEGSWDVITWVPLSKKRLRERGYDQAKLLAEELGKELNAAVLPLLCKEFHTKAQSSLKEASVRRANVVGAYAVVNTELLQGKRILLVDDVVTTGATLTECAVTLLAAGGSEVRAVTLARGKK